VLQSIAIVLKYQLAEKMLNETYYGGLNTFKLLTMLVAVIRSEKMEKEEEVCKVFEKVVKFYGT
jgi:DNA polymerase sigma